MMDRDEAVISTDESKVVDAVDSGAATEAPRYRRAPRSDLRKMAIAQGIDPDRQWEQLQKCIGIGKDCWESEAEFDRWLADIYARRKAPVKLPTHLVKTSRRRNR